MEKDADELLESFKKEDDEEGQEPRRRPQERLRPGAAPGAEPEQSDPAALAERVPVRFSVTRTAEGSTVERRDV